jgi:hypothetical protein
VANKTPSLRSLRGISLVFFVWKKEQTFHAKSKGLLRSAQSFFAKCAKEESPAGFVYLRKICVHLREIFLSPAKAQRRKGKALRALKNL